MADSSAVEAQPITKKVQLMVEKSVVPTAQKLIDSVGIMREADNIEE